MKLDPFTCRNDQDPKKKKVAIMNSDLLRTKIIDRLKQGGYFIPRQIEGSTEEQRDQEELRVIQTIE